MKNKKKTANDLGILITLFLAFYGLYLLFGGESFVFKFILGTYLLLVIINAIMSAK